MAELQQRQRAGEIVIKPSDKAGGWVIVDTAVYVAEGDRKLNEKYLTADGRQEPKYVRVDEALLKKHYKDLRKMGQEGCEKGFISVEDAMDMVPLEPKAARFYMNSKDHKPVDPRTGVPPWREVVSGSGSNTEGASKIVNYYLNQSTGKWPATWRTHATC